MKHRLVISEDLSIQDIEERVANGGRFIVYSYTISLLAITLKRFSPIYFIDSQADFESHKRRYNTISRIFGWWCIPWGPLRTTQSIRFNNKGALDLTEDVMLNLTQEDLAAIEVNIEETTLLFQQPERTDIKAFQKALARHQNLRLYIQKIVVGLYINTPEPYFVVGIETIGDYNGTCTSLRQAFHTQFLKSVRFEFIDLRQAHEWKSLLEKQGLPLSFEMTAK